LHYICVDNRVKKSNGSTYVIIENKQEIVLPPNITKVPALLLINKNYETIFGKESILKYLNPQENFVSKININRNIEPTSYSFNMGGYGVVSDNYSFLDQSAESLLTKGDGGFRQMYHYATLNHNEHIETPDENYVPDKIGNVSLDQLRQTRENL
jgi:ribosome biogenesis GTPase A